MKKNLLLVLFIFSVTFSFSQNSVWKLWDGKKAINSERIRQTPYSENQKLVQFNAAQFALKLANVPQKSSGQSGVEIQLPNINGQLEKFLVWESSNFEPALQAQFPEIRAFVGKGITDPSAVLNFSFDPRGIQTMIFRANTGTEFIEPYTKDSSVYIIFDSATRYRGQLPFTCSTEDFSMSQNLSNKLVNSMQSSAQSYKTMRLALSCTAEYTTYFGGTVSGALAAMNTTMTRCNGVFEKDLAIKLLIIANDNLVIYTNAATDPYATETGTGAPAAWNSQLQTTLNSVIGAANYDIGHLFGATGGGGNAGCIGCVCVDATKGSGITSPADGIPQGDNFDIDYVAHEMGHQMGANHTFAYGGISGTENNSVNVEPGSGSTIMSYAGIGGNGTDMQPHSDDYFTYKSISQIQSNMGTKTCPISTSLAVTNPKPGVAVQGAAYTIPVSTAFKLTGTGTGTTGEVLTYCWEENDDATIISPAASIPSPTKTDGPNFRSLLPSLSPVRYMPQFSDVLNGNLTPAWETTSSVARTLAFSFTVRDNVLGGGQTATAASTITVVDAGGAFSITNPNTQDVFWTPGTNQTITWNVAGTTGSGINTANVNILLSTDGGATFPTVLAAGTANDGTETVTLPSVASPTCRILIEAVGNIFYAVSKNVSLGYTIVNACNTYTYSTPIPFVDQAPGNYTTATLNVPVGGTISQVSVFNNITHTYLSDVQTDISSPQDSSNFIKLYNRSCGNTNGTLNLKFNDSGAAINCTGGNTLQTVVPGAPLAVFNGQNPQGTWTFRVYDNYAGDTGTVNSWGIEVCTQTLTLATPVNQLTDFTIYPNPNRGNFNIQFDNTTSNEIKVNVYDMRGRIIFENKYSNEVIFNQNIQLNNAQSGVYLVSVTDGSQKIVKRIVIE
jgi:subtilisin-like proprotein convertase family protein